MKNIIYILTIIASREQIPFIETKDIFVLDAVKSAKPLSAEVKNPEFEGMQPQLAMYKVDIFMNRIYEE